MEIILTAIEPPLADAWEKHCGDLENIRIHRGSIFELTCDAVVSPANSFGFMDGGIDWLYTRHFGEVVQERLQELIINRHHGELLVGTAEIVPTDNASIPYVISAPTMRVPMILKDTVHPYLAARAALLLVAHGHFPEAGENRINEVIKSVAFPGLGTGVGQVAPDICAQQVRAAIEDVLIKATSFPISWSDAQYKHQRLYTNQFRDLQFD